ncbi:MAG: type II toxin-antitoxin system VapC family toxin [Chromatiales bacterium]|nr:type II toxin-antitoxin system VapC family toxin [Chromatiales bacterium]
MVAIDTNVLVRLLTRDNETQFRTARALFAGHDIFIPHSVLLEAEWVLRCAYELAPAEVCTALRKVLGLANVHVDQPPLLSRVIDWHEAGLDFADALHLATSEGCEALKTFDRQFARRAGGLTPCPVELPN